MLRDFGRRGLNVAVGLALLAPAVGCRVDVYSPPPDREVVVESPPPDDGVVVVQEPPRAPDVVYEEEGRPRDGYIWVRGYQQWYHGHYRLVKGHYERVVVGRHWHEAHWQQGPRGYIWIEGRWE